MRRHLLLLASLLLAGPALAQTDPLTEEEKNRLLDQAKSLHDEANAVRTVAERRHGAAQRECWEKLLVSACLDDARQALKADSERARVLDKQAREIEREVKRREFADREARRLEEAPAREAAAAARAEKNRRAMEEVQRRIEKKQTEAASREH